MVPAITVKPSLMVLTVLTCYSSSARVLEEVIVNVAFVARV